MGFCIGDRVRSLVNDFPGLKMGECGTVIEYDCWGCAVVEWDEFSGNRHDADGLTRYGHGWFTSDSSLEIIFDNQDFGQLPEVSSEEIIYLFDM